MTEARIDTLDDDVTSTDALQPPHDVSIGRWSLTDPAEIGARFGNFAFPRAPGRYRLDVEYVHTPHLAIEWLRHDGDVVIEEAATEEQTFGVFGDRHGELVAGNARVRSRSVVAATTEPRVHRLSARNDYVVVAFPRPLVDVGDLTLLDLEPNSDRFARLASSLAGLRSLSRRDDVGGLALANATEGVADALYAVLEDARRLPGRCGPDLAQAIVMEALAAIREERATSIEELTREVAASRASLYRSFDAVLGISPYAYMQRRRLVRLRRRLLAVDDEPGVVTREAANLGAFHLGNLANSYRKLFGERPSDTVKRRPSTAPDHGILA